MEKPLLTFRENFKKDMKRFDHHIADLRKQLVGRYAAVEKVHTTDTDIRTWTATYCNTVMSSYLAEAEFQKFAGD